MTARRCRWGWHSWRFRAQTDTRMVTVPPHTAWICKLHEECRRCGLRRVRDNAPVPKRVKR